MRTRRKRTSDRRSLAGLMVRPWLVAIWLAFLVPVMAQAQDKTPQRQLSLPLVLAQASGCAAAGGQDFAALPVEPPPTDRPAEQHADLNLALRSYVATDGYRGLVDYNGPADPLAPQLPGLFGDRRTGVFAALHRVYDWNWSCNCRADPLTSPPVTLVDLVTTAGEAIHVPDSGYTIGSGFEVLVLYAAEDRITLKYTRNDNVVSGFTLHLEHLCVDPALVQLYRAWNAAGRGQLPALRSGQAFGRAVGSAVGVAVRDNGTFMDPRSRKDWWQGR